MTVEDWAGNFIKGYNYINGAIQRSGFTVIQGEVNTTSQNSGATKEINSSTPVQNCPTVNWYVCNKDASGNLYNCDYIKTTVTCEIDWINNGDDDPVLYNFAASGSGGGGGYPTPTPKATWFQLGLRIPCL